MHSPRLDHVVSHVSDWERSNAFYRDVVGAELIELPRGRWAYGFGEARLNVHGPGSAAQRVAALPAGAGERGSLPALGGADRGRRRAPAGSYG